MNRKQRIQHTITERLNPMELEIIDESERHRGHNGLESHFKLLVVSVAFNDMPLIARHRMVKTLLEPEFSSGMHALSLYLLTPAEREKSSKTMPTSPPCRSKE